MILIFARIRYRVGVRSAMKMSVAWVAALAVVGCSKQESAPEAAPVNSAAAPAPSTPPVASVAPSAPAPSASALAPRSDCPKGSSGAGTFDKPCEAKGTSRVMEATWTGKADDKGPQFRVINKSSLVILYGKIAVYFYDKAGKQLDVKESDGKTKPFKSCAGNSLFGGVMKAGEKAVLTFSCVKKEHVPEGATAMEGEVQMVGFADATEKKSDFYWKNDELAPDTRKRARAK